MTSNYEASKNSAKALEKSLSTLDKKIASTKAEKASIDNLPPIPASTSGFISQNDNENDSEPVEKKPANGIDRATVTKMVTEDMQKKGIIDKLEAKFANPDPV